MSADEFAEIARGDRERWTHLSRYTPARVALGRVGASLPTAEVLAFSLAHARARDAVHLPLDTEALAAALEAEGFATVQVRSQARDRSEYLRRPDLGRRLHSEDRVLLLDQAPPAPAGRLTCVVADGLSSLAPARHALPLLQELRSRLTREACPWRVDTVILASQARVALGDEIGELRGATAVVVLIGERPGLSSPDSLGLYLTYAPHPGCSDAERNCISNVRSGGLSYAEAAYKLDYLLDRALAAGVTGVSVKDASEWQPELSAGALAEGDEPGLL